jgi:glycosyltransferase involved in cell wall biosynthesis
MISIIIPSYNSEKYIDYAIRSIYDQSYNNYEIIVVDGNSSDDTISIISQYEDIIVISEDDNGQTEAINKGFAIANGDILFWLNSDDIIYDKDLLRRVSEYFTVHDDVGIVYSDYTIIDKYNKRSFDRIEINYDPDVMLFGVNLIGMAAFIRREVFQEIGPLNESLHYAMDYEYWLRAEYFNIKIKRLAIIGIGFRLHELSKTVSCRPQMKMERLAVQRQYISKYKPKRLKLLWLYNKYYRLKRQFVKCTQSRIIDIPFRMKYHRFRIK